MESHLCVELKMQARAMRTTYYTINVPSNATHRQSPNLMALDTSESSL